MKNCSIRQGAVMWGRKPNVGSFCCGQLFVCRVWFSSGPPEFSTFSYCAWLWNWLIWEVNVGGDNGILETFAALYCAIFRTPSLRKCLKLRGTSIASLGPRQSTSSILYRSVARLGSSASLWYCARTFCAWLWNPVIDFARWEAADCTAFQNFLNTKFQASAFAQFYS